jgi:hypothetical protein
MSDTISDGLVTSHIAADLDVLLSALTMCGGFQQFNVILKGT